VVYGGRLGDPVDCRYHGRVVVVGECRRLNWRSIRITPPKSGISFWGADIYIGVRYVKGNFDTAPDVLFDNGMHIGFKVKF